MDFVTLPEALFPLDLPSEVPLILPDLRNKSLFVMIEKMEFT